MLGMAEMATSIRENLRQQRKASKVAGSGAVPPGHRRGHRHGKDFELTLTGPAGGTWPASTTVDDLLNTEVPY